MKWNRSTSTRSQPRNVPAVSRGIIKQFTMVYNLAIAFLLTLGAAFAQKLTDLLSSEPNLTKWSNLIRPYWGELNALNNVTFLAPNNDAVTDFFNTPQIAGCPSTDADVLKAMMYYQIVDGVFEKRIGEYYATLLVNQTYSASQSNFTLLFQEWDFNSITSSSGQVAKYIGDPVKFEGGILQITDRVLHLPTDTLSTLLELNLTYAAAAYVNTNLGGVLDEPNMGLWAPTDEAFTDIGSVISTLPSDEAIPLMEYHIFNGSKFAHGRLNSQIGTLLGENTTFTEFDDADHNAITDYVNNAYQPVINIYRSKTAHLYIIDQVLNPANTTAPFNTSAWPNARPADVSHVTLMMLPPMSASATLCRNPFTSDGHRRRVLIAACVAGGVAGLCLAAGLLWLFRGRLKANTISDIDLSAELDGDKPAVEVSRHGDKKVLEILSEEKYELPSPRPAAEILGESRPAELAVATRFELPAYKSAAEYTRELDVSSPEALSSPGLSSPEDVSCPEEASSPGGVSSPREVSSSGEVSSPEEELEQRL